MLSVNNAKSCQITTMFSNRDVNVKGGRLTWNFHYRLQMLKMITELRHGTSHQDNTTTDRTPRG